MDPLLYDMWQYLSTEEILDLSLVSREFNQILSREATWEILIERDFKQKGKTRKDYWIKRKIQQWKLEIQNQFPSNEAFWKLIDLAHFDLQIKTFMGIPMIDDSLQDDETEETLFKKRIYYLLQSLTEEEFRKMYHLHERLNPFIRSWEVTEDLVKDVTTTIPDEIMLGGRNLVKKWENDPEPFIRHLQIFYSFVDEDIPEYNRFNHAYREYSEQEVLETLPLVKKITNFFKIGDLIYYENSEIEKLLPYDNSDIILKNI